MPEPTDHELAEFEAALRQIRPAPLSAGLLRRISALKLAESAGGAKWKRFAGVWGAVFAASAAAVAVGLVVQSRRAGSVPLEPISSVNLLLSATDEGAVTLGDGTPARRIRASYVQTTQWKDPASKAKIIWSVPSEEVQIFPISYE